MQASVRSLLEMFVPVTRFNRGQLSGKWGGRHVHHKSFYLQYSHKEQNLMGLDMTESGRKVCFHCTKHWSVHFIKHMKWNTLRNLEKKKSFSAESQAHLFFMYGSFWLWKSWSVQLELFLRYIGLKIVLCSLWSLSKCLLSMLRQVEVWSPDCFLVKHKAWANDWQCSHFDVCGA